MKNLKSQRGSRIGAGNVTVVGMIEVYQQQAITKINTMDEPSTVYE